MRQWFKCGCKNAECRCCKRDVPEEYVTQEFNHSVPCVDEQLIKSKGLSGACPFCGACLQPKRTPTEKPAPERVYTSLLSTQLDAYFDSKKSRENNHVLILGIAARNFPMPLAVWEMFDQRKEDTAGRLPGARTAELVKAVYLAYTIHASVNPHTGQAQSRVLFIPGVEESKTNPEYSTLWENYRKCLDEEDFADAYKAMKKHQTRQASKQIHDKLLEESGYGYISEEIALYARPEQARKPKEKKKRTRSKGAGE